MKRFMQMLLASLGVFALMLAGCNTDGGDTDGGDTDGEDYIMDGEDDAVDNESVGDDDGDTDESAE